MIRTTGQIYETGDFMNIKRLIKVSRGNEKADLVLKNSKVINVFTGEIVEGDVAVSDGIIAGVGKYNGKKETDLNGKYVAPGFINAHVHVESSMVTPFVYSMEELKWGTTTIITDPHEIANVNGMIALENILKAAKQSPVNYYVMLPSCVPATSFEHSGAILNTDNLAKLKNDANVLGLGEMMNTAGVLNCDDEVLKKLSEFSDKIIDGHSPMLSGNDLNAYICSGVQTDHESVTYEEAVEKLRCGMSVLVREGSASKNLEAIISGVVKNGTDTFNMAFCTDDKHLADVKKDGTIRYNIKKSVELGLSPIKAIQMATINAARIYGLKNIGAVACGYKADIVVLDDIKTMKINDVYKDGVRVSELKSKPYMKFDKILFNSVNAAPLSENSFVIPEKGEYTVIGIVENQIITKKLTMSGEEVSKGIKNGTVRKIAVIERHHATGNVAAAYISGYGLKHGAVATTVAHDSHNIIVIGDNDIDMKLAAEQLEKIHGGYTIVKDGKVIDSLPLELSGLMSVKSADEFIPMLDRIINTAYEMGVNRNIDPFITLSFMALPVIPEIRITDCGLFDSANFSFIK